MIKRLIATTALGLMLATTAVANDNPLGVHPILAQPLTEGEKAYIRGDHRRSNDTKELVITNKDTGKKTTIVVKEKD